MKCTLIAVAGYMALALSSTADAESVYSVNIGVDYSNVATRYGRFGAPPEATIEDDFSGIGGRVGFGVAFSGGLAFEGGWTRFGDNSATALYSPICPGLGCPQFITDVKQSGSAFWVAYTPTMHRRDWSFLGKLGAAKATIETKSNEAGERAKDSATAPLVGVGTVYHFSDDLGLRFDLDWMGGKATTFGVGISYRF